MILVDASQRLSKLEFAADEDWQVYPRSIYTCPNCKKQVSICMRDLERHSFSEFTNLSEKDAEKMQDAVSNSGREYNSFLDFYCVGCHAPVRVYYDFWAGGRFTHGYTLRLVAEGRPA